MPQKIERHLRRNTRLIALPATLLAAAGASIGCGSNDNTQPLERGTVIITPSKSPSLTESLSAVTSNDLNSNTPTSKGLTNLKEVIQSSNGVELFEGYHGPSGTIRMPNGKIISMRPGQRILAECLIEDQKSGARESTGGAFYRVAGNQMVDGIDVSGDYFASNTAFNQQISRGQEVGPEQDNVYDPNIAMCPDSPFPDHPDVHHPLLSGHASNESSSSASISIGN